MKPFPIRLFFRRIPAVQSAGLGCFLFICLTALTHATDLPASLTLDLPIPLNLATPSWLGHPTIPPTTFATLNLPILTPAADASLLVTVYFQEKTGGFMRIIWQGTQGAEVLSDNFYEDIGMANQRSLLISQTTLAGDGTLIFQCGDTNLGIQRIKLEWLQNKNGLVSSDVHDTLVTPSVGATQGALSLNGQANPVQPGAWRGDIVTVPLIDSPLRIEQGVDFSVDLDTVPGSARIALKEAGLPLGKHLVVWINQQRAGTITPTVPDLLDEGFVTDAKATTSYIGWRDGSFSVPVSLLKSGINTVQFSDEDDETSTPANTAPSDSNQEPPLALKTLAMQLNYVSNPATASNPAPAIEPAPAADSTDATPSSSTPTGPISPQPAFLTTPPDITTP